METAGRRNLPSSATVAYLALSPASNPVPKLAHLTIVMDSWFGSRGKKKGITGVRKGYSD